MSDIVGAKPTDLLRRLATKRDWSIEITEGAGHTKVRLGDHRTVIPRHATDVKSGTFRAVLKQRGLSETDLER